MRISTGIRKLDDMMGGGLPENSSILLKGPPGTGKTTLCQQFLYSGLQGSDKGFYITSDASPEDVMGMMSGFSWNIESYLKAKMLMFLDIYSWRTGGSREMAWKKVIQGSPDIDTINVTLTELLEKLENSHRTRGVFDSLSALLIYLPTELVIKFIPIFIAKSRKRESTNLLVLEEGVHDEKTVNTLNFLTDGLIETKMEGNSKFLRITRMKGTSCNGEWIEYDVTPSGIQFR